MNEKIRAIIDKELKEKTGILDFYDCPLSEWPMEIFEMTWLTVLNINPNSKWDGQNFTIISIKYEGAITAIPEEIKLLTKLMHLSLSMNIISKIENLDKLTQISFLDLRLNQITKIENLDNLTQITSLYLGYNQITKIECLENLTQITSLDLNDNQITKIENLDNLTQITFLQLTSNQISKIENLDKLTQIKFLDLSNNQIPRIENLYRLTQIKELSLSDNQITKIENLDNLTQITFLDLRNNQISKIQNLDSLAQITSLTFSINQISRIENLENLTQITSLDFGNNQISKIENLENLTQITSLDFGNNQISKIENLDKLTQIKFLDLSDNQITKIENLDNLTQITELSLKDNQISKIENLDKLSNLHRLYLRKNPIEGITQEELSAIGGELKKILKKAKEIASGLLKDIVLPCKVILLGNSEDGKTSLSKKIINDPDQFTKADDDSTHGLKIRPWYDDDSLKALIYDFGGQDYYHAVYNMFFSSHAQYLLLWDANRINNIHIGQDKKGESLDGNKQYIAFCPQYWLGNIHYYTQRKQFDPNNKIKLTTIQNIRDGVQAHILETTHKEDIPAIDFQYQMNLKSTADLDQKRMEVFLLTLTQDVNDLQRPFPVKSADRVRIKDIIDSVGNPKNKYKEKSVAVFKKHMSDKSDTYLKTLHLMGFVLYYPEIRSLRSKYWIDPATVSDRIYTFLDDIGASSFDIDAFGTKDRTLIELMKEQEVIFLDPESKKYIIPQYLKAADDDPLFGLASIDLHQGFHIQFKHFLPHGLMSRLMCRFGTKENLKHFYKNDLVFSEYAHTKQSPIRVRIKLDPIALKLSVFIKFTTTTNSNRESYFKYLFQSIIAAYWNEKHKDYGESLAFEQEVHNYKNKEPKLNRPPTKNSYTVDSPWRNETFEKYVPSDLLISIDDQLYVPYGDIITYDYKERVELDRLPIVTIEYKEEVSSNKDTKLKTQVKKKQLKRSLFDPFVRKKADKIKTVFISYSHDDLQYRRELQKFLINLQRDHVIELWQDGEIRPGMDWDKSIKENIEKADVFIMLVSQNFISSSYIHHTEMKKAFEQMLNGTTKILPILISDCDWEEWNVYGIDVSEEQRSNGQVSNYQFLPKANDTDERILPINQWEYPEMAWKQVVKYLRK